MYPGGSAFMIQIRPLKECDFKAASDMFVTCYKAFVSNDTGPGQDAFWDVVSPEAIAASCHEGNLYLAAFDTDRLIGAAGMEGTRHLKTLFVNGAYHGQGIARQLWEALKAGSLETDPSEQPFTVNSSDYALGVYERFGFEQTAPRQTKNGIDFTPMKLYHAKQK